MLRDEFTPVKRCAQFLMKRLNAVSQALEWPQRREFGAGGECVGSPQPD
jgi:hypothetical protein